MLSIKKWLKNGWRRSTPNPELKPVGAEFAELIQTALATAVIEKVRKNLGNPRDAISYLYRATGDRLIYRICTHLTNRIARNSPTADRIVAGIVALGYHEVNFMDSSDGTLEVVYYLGRPA